MEIDLIELGTFILAFIAFLFILITHSESSKKENHKILGWLLLFSSFILLNRISTNMEFLMFERFFDILQHSSMLIASVVFLIFIFASNKIPGKIK